jgi:hypothetical protein
MEHPNTPRRPVEIGPLNEAASKPLADKGAPADHASESAAVEALNHRGFTAEFVIENGALRVAGSDRRLRPEEVSIRDYYRFEGTSDPSDMSVIYALEAKDGTKGTMVDAFGTYADPLIANVIDRMRMSAAPAAKDETPRSHRYLTAVLGGVGALVVGVAAIFVARRRRGA